MWLKYLQKGPWQSNLHIFLTVTPIEVIPKPMFSIHRARYDGVIFVMLSHIENATFAIPLL